IRNENGERVLSTQYDTVRIEAMDAPIVDVGVLPPQEVIQRVQGVQGVAGSFFNTLEQNAANTDTPHTRHRYENGENPTDGGESAPQKEGARTTEPPKEGDNGDQLLKDTGDSGPTIQPKEPLDPTKPNLKTGDPTTGSNGDHPQITILDEDTSDPSQGFSGDRYGDDTTAPRPSPLLGSDGDGNLSGSDGGSTGDSTQPPPLSGSDPLPTDPNVINPPPPPGSDARQNLNDPLGSANNIRVLSGLPTGEQYGFAVTTVLNTVTGFDDIVLLRGDVSNGTSGNFTVFAGNASINSSNNLSGALYEDITDNSPNTTNENIFSVASGNFYGDGTHELMIGTPNGFNAQGSANDGYLYHIDLGGTLGPQQFDDYTVSVSTVNVDPLNSRIGNSVANLGDINNDGFTDFGFTSPGLGTTGVATLVT
ncbi:MAG: hypothetical protein VXW88_02805, partial [Pseudomonadota bacterium]|nr:hypothetical protein [Pseudomonadota bacterium]